MPIPSGGGSEILNRKFYTVANNTDTKILDGEANHIYTVLSIIITETAGNAETFGLFLDPNAGGTDYEIISMNNTGCYYLPNFSLLNIGTNIEYERCNSQVQSERIRKA